MGALSKLKARLQHQHIGTASGLVFEVKRVRSADMLRVGYASLEGDRALAEVQKTHALERKQARLDEAGKKKLEEIQIKQMERYLGRVIAKSESAVAFQERLEAYICAGVVAAGELTPQAMEQLGLGPDRPAVVIGPDFDPGTWTVDGMEPMRFVRKEEEQDEDNDALWVEAIDDPTERSVLAMLIMGRSSEVAQELRPFRGSSGGADEDPGSVPPVREVAT